MATEPLATPRRGWRVVAQKEFADHFHSARLVILTLLLGLAGLAAVLSALSSIRDAAPQASGTPALFLQLFAFAGEGSRLPSFVSLVAMLGPLLGIAFGFDAVNGERANGTLPRLLSQPIYRDDVVNGKFVAGLGMIGLVLSALTAFVAAIGMIRLGVVPGWTDAVRIVAYLVVSLVYIGFWLALAMLASVWLRRAATSALASIAAWLVLTLFAFLLVGLLADAIAPLPPDATPDEQLANAQWEQTLSRLSPATLYEEATGVLLNPQARAVGLISLSQLFQLQSGAVPNPLPLTESLLIVWPQAIGLGALTVVTFAVAYIVFMRQEVRA